jgi:GT2 family glycosyltransferase
MPEVSVVIPVLDGGSLFAGVLEALRSQTVEHELLVCDSGSRDGSAELARAHGARVLEIPRASFTHGGVRNRLMREARGEYVALLTQDSEPAEQSWLSRLLEGFELAPDVGIVYGPYHPRPDAAAPVRLEIERWFSSLSPDGQPRAERLLASEMSLPVRELVGRRGFFTDANACVAHGAWENVPFREVPYAEDRVLAIDMLRAGYAKAYVPAAAVIHSHTYGALDLVRRSFDESRALLEVYRWREPASPASMLSQLRGELSGARRELAGQEMPAARRAAALAAVAGHHAARRAGSLLGSHADRLPPSITARMSLEGRPGFAPLSLDGVRVSTTDDNGAA